MSKPKSKKSKAKAKAKHQPKPQKQQPAVAENPDCPYRGGTLYAALFTEANKGYVNKTELIKKVAELTGKSEKVVGFAFQVLKSPTHRSNKNRSSMLTEGDKVKLIANRSS